MNRNRGLKQLLHVFSWENGCTLCVPLKRVLMFSTNGTFKESPFQQLQNPVMKFSKFETIMMVSMSAKLGKMMITLKKLQNLLFFIYLVSKWNVLVDVPSCLGGICYLR